MRNKFTSKTKHYLFYLTSQDFLFFLTKWLQSGVYRDCLFWTHRHKLSLSLSLSCTHSLTCSLSHSCSQTYPHMHTHTHMPYRTISFIFILWIHMDMKIVIHKHTYTYTLLHVLTQSHILSHIHIPLTHTFFISNMCSGNFNGKTNQLRAEPSLK